jgi:DNA transformation protein
VSVPVHKMHSLGPVTVKRLAEVGINTSEELTAIGAVAAYRNLKFRFGRDVTLNALYGLDAAIRDVHWRTIDAETKARLRREAGVGYPAINLAARPTTSSNISVVSTPVFVLYREQW